METKSRSEKLSEAGGIDAEACSGIAAEASAAGAGAGVNGSVVAAEASVGVSGFGEENGHRDKLRVAPVRLEKTEAAPAERAAELGLNEEALALRNVARRDVVAARDTGRAEM